MLNLKKLKTLKTWLPNHNLHYDYRIVQKPHRLSNVGIITIKSTKREIFQDSGLSFRLILDTNKE